jgi:hypothetical protein
MNGTVDDEGEINEKSMASISTLCLQDKWVLNEFVPFEKQDGLEIDLTHHLLLFLLTSPGVFKLTWTHCTYRVNCITASQLSPLLK